MRSNEFQRFSKIFKDFQSRDKLEPRKSQTSQTSSQPLMDYNPPLSRHQKSTLDLGDPTLQFTPRKKASKIITQYETYTKHIYETYGRL
jgi:hypothetical protein